MAVFLVDYWQIYMYPPKGGSVHANALGPEVEHLEPGGWNNTYWLRVLQETGGSTPVHPSLLSQVAVVRGLWLYGSLEQRERQCPLQAQE